MTKFLETVSRVTFTSALAFGIMPDAASANDLSSYRNLQLGADLPSIAKQVGASTSQARTVQRRAAVIQELEWHPHPLGSSAQTESVQQVIFNFYDRELYHIATDHDRYQTEGMTAYDFIEAISATYGIAEKPLPTATVLQGRYGDQEQLVARWQLAVFLRSDPFLVWPELQADWIFEKAASAGPRRHHRGEASR